MAENKTPHVKTAGFDEEDSLFYAAGPAACGKIGDGVGFWHGSKGGAWVVALSDLKRIVREAEEARRG